MKIAFGAKIFFIILVHLDRKYNLKKKKEGIELSSINRLIQCAFCCGQPLLVWAVILSHTKNKKTEYLWLDIIVTWYFVSISILFSKCKIWNVLSWKRILFSEKMAFSDWVYQIKTTIIYKNEILRSKLDLKMFFHVKIDKNKCLWIYKI